MRRIPAPRMHLWLMLALTFTTGINDAIGYLGLDKVFTGNMTGNVVILGMALAGAEDLPVLGPALALAGFMAGAAIAGRALRRAGRPWTPGVTWVLAVVAALMFGLAGVLAVAGDEPGQPVMVTVTTLAALGMGLQAAAARHIAVKDVTTVVVTSTITGLAADSVFGAGRGGNATRRTLAIVLILAGAAAGTLLLQLHAALGLALAGLVIAAVTLIGALHERLERSRLHPPATTSPIGTLA